MAQLPRVWDDGKHFAVVAILGCLEAWEAGGRVVLAWDLGGEAFESLETSQPFKQKLHPPRSRVACIRS
eukprot:677918-Amphidinium_carterae.1